MTAGLTKRITVLGAGSWGSTLTWLFASAGKSVRLYTQDAAKAALINREHCLSHPIKVPIPSQVVASCDLGETLSDADVVVFCCTSQSMRQLASAVARALPEGRRPIVVSAVKGLELSTLKRMSEVLQEILPDSAVCSLSGPNLAAEILAGLPAAAVVASKDKAASEAAQQALSVPKFRLYSNQDVTGVELGGTLKNIIAIAAGICDELKLGANAKAALLTRGLAEMVRLSQKLGAESLTLYGLSGMGDLFATCSGPTSRNYRLGMELAKGKKLGQILDEMGAVVEGVPTTEAVCELSKQLGLELPIAEQVESTLKGKSSPEGAIMTLMGRPLSSELKN